MSLQVVSRHLILVSALAISYIGATMSQVVVLKVGDAGTRSELAARQNPDHLVLLHNPGLSALLARAESLAGSTLTDSEKRRIADGAPPVAVPKEVAEATHPTAGLRMTAPRARPAARRRPLSERQA